MSKDHNPGIAAVLSLPIPGVGQFYNGAFWRGIFWLIFTPGVWIGTGGFLGWICHLISAITAYNYAKRSSISDEKSYQAGAVILKLEENLDMLKDDIKDGTLKTTLPVSTIHFYNSNFKYGTCLGSRSSSRKMEWIFNQGKRLARIIAGFVLLLIGLFLAIPGIPGPGFIFILLGLSILAVDFLWAERLKKKCDDGVMKAINKVRNK